MFNVQCSMFNVFLYLCTCDKYNIRYGDTLLGTDSDRQS